MLDRREIERLRQVESDAEQEQLCLLDVEERDQYEQDIRYLSMRLEDLERDRKAEERPLKEAIKQIKADVREQMRERERARAAGQEMLTADVPEVREEAAQAMPEIEALDTL